MPNANSKGEKGKGKSLNNERLLIRFQVKNETFIYVKPQNVLFAEASDHYVKALISTGKEEKWVIRHCTLKELLLLLSQKSFIRLNRFYLVNKDRIVCLAIQERYILFDSNSKVLLKHHIDAYMLPFLVR